MAGLRWVAERRILRRASHQSLKVAVFRDQPFDAVSHTTPVASYARGDWDADFRRGDQGENRVATETVHTERPAQGAVREMSRPTPTPVEDDSWIDDQPATGYRTVAPPVTSSNSMTFRAASRPWYGSPRLVLAIVGTAVAALVVCVVLLVMRNSASGTEQITTVTPTATTSAVPQPAPPPEGSVGQPLPPEGIPPPPPPPPEDQAGSAPANPGYYPRRPSSRSDDGGPTRRPQTPAEISAVPTVKPAPAPGHSAPGDAPARRRGFF